MIRVKNIPMLSIASAKVTYHSLYHQSPIGGRYYRQTCTVQICSSSLRHR